MNEEQATAESSSECSSLHSWGREQRQFYNPSSREAGRKLKELRGSWCLLALPTQQCLLTAKEKLLAAPLNLAIKSKQKKVSCDEQEL